MVDSEEPKRPDLGPPLIAPSEDKGGKQSKTVENSDSSKRQPDKRGPREEADKKNPSKSEKK